MSVVILVDYEEIRVVNDLDGWGCMFCLGRLAG